MEVFLAALLLLGIGVLGMCFNIIVRKKDFPQTEIGSNEEMRKRGILCMKEQEAQMWKNKSCGGNISDSCSSCGFYQYEKH